MAKPEIRRCAIYTRKSSEEGLDQDFNSLHAQREACEAFILSQRSEGWRLIDGAYDDGGLSGGNMERPALRRLLSDIAAGRIDIIVVYKVDRLTRSLADFARMVEQFDKHRTSFVAVTQQFNTATSMGRLTLNMLLSFAQFEREVTSERIRDKIAASKRKGMWMGGVTPLDYEVRERKLMVVPAEAKTVHHIFERYLELGSVRQLKQDLDRNGIRSKIRRLRNGSLVGGKPFSRGALYALLANPIYVGEIAHNKARYPGQQKAIIDRSLWDAVQSKLRAQGPGPFANPRTTSPSPLLGKLFDEAGRPLTTSHTKKSGRIYRYYISSVSSNGHAGKAPGWRVPAKEIEKIVADLTAQSLADRTRLANEIESAGVAPTSLPATFSAADNLERQIRSGSQWSDAFSVLVERVELGSNRVKLALSLASLVPQENLKVPTPLPKLTREFPLQLKRRGVEMRLLVKDGPAMAARPDQILLGEVARAYRCFEGFASGKVGAMLELSRRENVDERYVRRLLPLAFLAPDIVNAIVAGMQPVDLTVKKMLRRAPVSNDWLGQKQGLGFS